MWMPARLVSAEPLVLRVGSVQASVAEPFVCAALTLIVKGASAAEAVPSLALMVMLASVCALAGVPESWPVAMLKLAQLGLLLTENDSVFPAESLAVGVKEYAEPATTLLAGVPVMVTVEEPPLAAVTAMLNHSSAVVLPSAAAIAMLPYFPTLAAVGVPLSCPFLALKVAQAGLLTTEKVMVRPAASVVVGVNE